MISIAIILTLPIREEVYFIDPDKGYVVVHSALHIGRRADVTRFYPQDFDTTNVIYVNTHRKEWHECFSPDSIPGKCLTLRSERFYTILERDVDTLRLKKVDDSTYSFSNEIGSFLVPYERVFAFFLLPRDYETVGYGSDVEGDWIVIDDNMLKFVATNLKRANLQVSIRKKPTEGTPTITKPEIPLPAEIVADTAYQEWIVPLAPRVYFPLGSYTLTAEARRGIRELYRQIDFDKIDKLIIVGHTDSLPFRKGAREPVSSNWELSAMRAAKVARYLIELGAPPEKLVIKGHAYTLPAASNSTPEGRAKNRRVEFYVKLLADEGKSGGEDR